MTVHDWVRQASVRLAAVGVDASRLEAQVLAAHAMSKDRTAILTHPSSPIPETADDLLERRLKGEPLAYILGYREFYSRRFDVNPAVLIPRQETEILVETAIELAPKSGHVLDVGTGSGCVAITLQLERPDLTVFGTDISEAALETAKANAGLLGANVEFFISDLLTAVQGQFDLIVSNPPYIEEAAELPKEIRDHEPAIALFAGTDGMNVYLRLAVEAKPHLNVGGSLILELGDGMLYGVSGLFESRGWRVIEYRKDLDGTERVLVVATD